MESIDKTKVALVSGGNRGIGYAVVEGLASLGYKVLLGSRNIQSGNEAAAKINGDIVPVELDLSDSNKLENQVKNILSDHPQIDVLVNNAGILENGNLLELTPEKFRASMRVNFEAPYDLIRLIVPNMIEQGYGRVVNVSSGWGSFNEGLGGPSAYAVSKAALNALTHTLAQTISSQNIKVNAVCPGWVRTRMGGQAADRSPEKGAETIIWLATLPNDGPTGSFFRDKQKIGW